MTLPVARPTLLAFLGGALAVVGYYFAPNALVLGLALGGLLALAAWRLEAILGLVLVVAPLNRLPRELDSASLGLAGLIGERSVEFTLQETLIVLAVTGWLIRLVTDSTWRARLVRVRPGISDLGPPLLFLAAALLSLLGTELIGVALRELRRVIVEPLLFAGLLWWVVRERRQVLGWLDALVLLGLGMAVFSLFHYSVIGVVERTGGVARILAIYHSPNELALFLGRILPVAVVLALFRRPVERWRLAGYVLTAALLTVVLFLTFSRGAWLGVAAGVGLALLLRGDRRWLIAAAAATVLASLALVLSGAAERALSVVTSLRRLYLWQSALAMIRDHPILGVGMDNFLYQYRERYILPEAALEPDLSHPHNLVLDVWTRLGIVGVAAVLWLQIVFWRRGVRALTLSDSALVAAGLALMASMADFLVHGLIDNSLFLADLAVLFWLTWVLMGRLVRDPT